ncbi:MAG: Translation initiation factor IF-3 [Parcubacteria group bacterium GW2011_GWA1_59_11]|nr:MAG: Translation initiation factor IF-3 [Parcubacteria group bacterium GW2011_GWA1_59_11]
MRIIGENGENLGIMSREEALRLASPESGLDLIEVVAKADPPVARLMSYDKYRYEREKAEKKERKAHKFAEMKRVQISARAAENDLLTKIKQLEKFLTEGHQVEVFVRLRGREKYNRDWANKKLTEFLQMIKMEYKVLGAPKFAQGLSIQIAKKI